MTVADFAREHKVANDPIVGKIAWYCRKNHDADDTELRLPYVTLCSAGIKNQGEFTTSFSSADQAWESYWQHLLELVAGREGVLHWRLLPNLVEDEFEKGCFVISRVAFEPCALQVPQ